MEKEPKIWIITVAYNAERTLVRTIESVLNQTYPNFYYLIRDNGSTDGTYEICKKYAEKDPRIHLIRNKKNLQPDEEEQRIIAREENSIRYGHALADGDFSCVLDADDTYFPDFFRRAVEFSVTEDLDIVACGTEMIEEKTGQLLRTVEQDYDIVVAGEDFSNCFAGYHWYMRTLWGKLYRKGVMQDYPEYIKAFREREFSDREAKTLVYGWDTVITLYGFSQARRVGFLSGVGHRYYIQKKSVSTTLQSNRVESDVVLHRATENFLLTKCGSITAENKRFLAIIYANAVNDTTGVIGKSTLAPAEKLREFRRIAENPITEESFLFESPEIMDSRTGLLYAALQCECGEYEDLKAVANALVPHCAKLLTWENVSFFLQERTLLAALLQDKAEEVLSGLLELIRTQKNSKRYDWYAMVRALSADKPLLRKFEDKQFLRRHGDIYLSIWRGQYAQALDDMTGVLLESGKAEEAFLQLYLSLAALQNEAGAFVFGKVQLARLALRRRDYDACRALLGELEEMGMEDNDEIAEIHKKLNESKEAKL